MNHFTIVRILRILFPAIFLNNALLTFPLLYKTKFVNFETGLDLNKGMEDLIDQLNKSSCIDGDIIECGCHRAGTSILMAYHLRKMGISKQIYALDSFKGFDREELRRERNLGLTNQPDNAFQSTTFKYVSEKINVLKLSSRITLVEGYFQEILPNLRKKICFGLIDCDLKNSLLYCAENLWPNLEKGGRLVFDDYKYGYFKGARMGVDIFVEKHKSEIGDYGLLNRLYFVEKKT